MRKFPPRILAVILLLAACAGPSLAVEPDLPKFVPVEIPIPSNFDALMGVSFSDDSRQLAVLGWQSRYPSGISVWLWDSTSKRNNWRVEEYPCGRLDHKLLYSGFGGWSVAFSHDGKQVLTMQPFPSEDGKHVVVIDARSKRKVQEFECVPKANGRGRSKGGIHAFAFSPDLSKFAACSSQHDADENFYIDHNLGEAWVWDMKSGKLLIHHEWTEGGYQFLAFSRDGKRLAVGGMDRYAAEKPQYSGQVSVLNCETGLAETIIPRKGVDTSAVEFSFDGSEVYIGGGREALQAYRLDTGKMTRQLKYYDLDGTGNFAHSPAGEFIALTRTKEHLGGQTGVIDVLRTSDFTKVFQIDPGIPKRSLRTLYGIAYSPDGKLIAAVSYREVHLWRLNPGILP